MDKVRFYRILDIDSADEFKYYENLSALLEEEEYIEENLIKDLIRNADREKLAEHMNSYFDGFLDHLPDNETDLYVLVESMGRVFDGLIMDEMGDADIDALASEISKFRKWYVHDLNAFNKLTGEESSVRDARFDIAAAKLLGDFPWGKTVRRGHQVDALVLEREGRFRKDMPDCGLMTRKTPGDIQLRRRIGIGGGRDFDVQRDLRIHFSRLASPHPVHHLPADDRPEPCAELRALRVERLAAKERHKLHQRFLHHVIDVGLGNVRTQKPDELADRRAIQLNEPRPLRLVLTRRKVGDPHQQRLRRLWPQRIHATTLTCVPLPCSATAAA